MVGLTGLFLKTGLQYSNKLLIYSHQPILSSPSLSTSTGRLVEEFKSELPELFQRQGITLSAFADNFTLLIISFSSFFLLLFLMEQMNVLVDKTTDFLNGSGKSEPRKEPKILFEAEQSKGFIPECNSGTSMSDSRSQRLLCANRASTWPGWDRLLPHSRLSAAISWVGSS